MWCIIGASGTKEGSVLKQIKISFDNDWLDDMSEGKNLYGIGHRTDALTVLIKEAPSGAEIMNVCLDIAEMLLKKNISYGNSAIAPVRVLSQANAEEQILIRIDDKLNRLKYQQEYENEDTVQDLVGYFILLMVMRRQEAWDNGDHLEDED